MFLEDIFKGLVLGVTSQILLYFFFKLYVTLLAKTFVSEWLISLLFS